MTDRSLNRACLVRGSHFIRRTLSKLSPFQEVAIIFGYRTYLFFPLKDRVVDDLNPVLNFTRKEVESLLHFVEEEPQSEKILLESQRDLESVIYRACELYPNLITKV